MLNDPLLIAGLVACVAVLVILLLGVNSFRKGGLEGSKRSNKYMQLRIAAQFVAVLLLLAFVFFRQQSGG